MPLLSIIVPLLIVGAILAILHLAPIDPTIKQIILIVVILGVILWLLNILFGLGPGVQLR